MIYFNLKKTFLLFLSSLLSLLSFAQNQSVAYTIFQPGVISSTDYSEGSPGITADGQTMVFTRFTTYNKQVPFIATKTRNSWSVKRWSVIDTLYNLAISPDGNRIVYKVRREAEGEVSYATYQVDRSGEGWEQPRQLPGPLFVHAGYFRIARDGTLYLYINRLGGNKGGIYTAEPDGNGSYQTPKWLSDAVSPYYSTTYTPIPNADETKLIVNRAGLSGRSSEKLGPAGLYLHQKNHGQWDTGVRVTGIPYTYYAAVFPDDRLIFQHQGDLYQIPLRATNIAYSESSQYSQVVKQHTAMEQAYAKKGSIGLVDFYFKRGGFARSGKVKADYIFNLRKALRDTTKSPIAFTTRTLANGRDWNSVQKSTSWQQIPATERPVPLEDIDLNRDPGGLYELALEIRTYLQDGARKAEQEYVIRYWIEQWGEQLIQVASYP